MSDLSVQRKRREIKVGRERRTGSSSFGASTAGNGHQHQSKIQISEQKRIQRCDLFRFQHLADLSELSVC